MRKSRFDLWTADDVLTMWYKSTEKKCWREPTSCVNCLHILAPSSSRISYLQFYQCAMRKYMPTPTSRICNNSAILISILVDSHSPSFHRHPTYENNNSREERRRGIETKITKWGTVLGEQVRYNSIRSKVNVFTGTHTRTSAPDCCARQAINYHIRR